MGVSECCNGQEGTENIFLGLCSLGGSWDGRKAVGVEVPHRQKVRCHGFDSSLAHQIVGEIFPNSGFSLVVRSTTTNHEHDVVFV
jgi:hypothetical protein